MNLQILYEDNHLIAVNKSVSDLVQGDKTGDVTLPERIKQYLKETYNKSGNVFCGVTHRLDRPVSGVVLFAKTGKALKRMNALFQQHGVHKIYWAIVGNAPQAPEGTLSNYLVRNERLNKSFAYDMPCNGAKLAVLHYRTLAHSQHYTLLEVQIETGRHHQIRCQLAHIGAAIKGDLKYGAPRSNPEGGIALHARSIAFEHPVSHQHVCITAPVPDNRLWQEISKGI